MLAWHGAFGSMMQVFGRLLVALVLHGAVLGAAWMLNGGLYVADWPVLFLTGCGILAMQWLVFIPSALLKTEKVYDLTGGLTYVTAACGLFLTVYGLGEGSPRAAVLGLLVVIWAVRLSGFLFLRIHRAGKDGRFDDIKQAQPHFWWRGRCRVRGCFLLPFPYLW